MKLEDAYCKHCLRPASPITRLRKEIGGLVGWFTLKLIVGETEMDRSQVSRALNKMVLLGILEAEGTTVDRRFRWVRL